MNERLVIKQTPGRFQGYSLEYKTAVRGPPRVQVIGPPFSTARRLRTFCRACENLLAERATEQAREGSEVVSWVSRLVMRLSHRSRQMKGEAELGELLLSATKGQAALAAQRSLLEQRLPRPFLTAWHPLPTTSAALRLTLAGHTDSVHGCAVSLAGDFIVSASGNETLKVWDVPPEHVS